MQICGGSMKTFTVEIYAVDWCEFSEHYQIEAEDETCAEDKAMEDHEENFAGMHGLLMTDHGYIESEDIDEEGNYDEGDCTALMACVRD